MGERLKAEGRRQKQRRFTALVFILTCAFILLPSASLPLQLMHRMLAQALAILLEFDLWGTAGYLDLGSVVQVTGFRALKPSHFAILFCHHNIQKGRRMKAEG
jgi:hypothetical protein